MIVKIKSLEIISEVYRIEDRLYKSMPKYNIDNEMFFLNLLGPTGYVPLKPVRESVDLISMEYIHPESVTDPDEFMKHYNAVIVALESRGVRHGDLTEYAVLVRDNKPVIIDFAESRVDCSPIPDKRPGGDRYWLKKTMELIASEG
jgi:RIO-like serine/threonine protein kinase